MPHKKILSCVAYPFVTMHFMTKQKILIAEDDRKTADLIRMYMENNGYLTIMTDNGQEALHLAQTRQPDLIILDWMMPKVDGLDVCQAIRHEQGVKNVPIIMLTAKSTEEDKLLGLGLGADDYVTKPFSPRELVARVKAVMRRTSNGRIQDSDQIQIGDICVNFARYEVTVRGEKVTLTPKEFKLLAIFIHAPNRVFTRQELVTQAFGHDYDGLERTVDSHMMKLRKKIEQDTRQPRYIQTVFGVGYKLTPPEAGDSHV